MSSALPQFPLWRGQSRVFPLRTQRLKGKNSKIKGFRKTREGLAALSVPSVPSVALKSQQIWGGTPRGLNPISSIPLVPYPGCIWGRVPPIPHWWHWGTPCLSFPPLWVSRGGDKCGVWWLGCPQMLGFVPKPPRALSPGSVTPPGPDEGLWGLICSPQGAGGGPKVGSKGLLRARLPPGWPHKGGKTPSCP